MPQAQLTVDPNFAVGTVNRRLFGSFVEHLGRCVYDGIYEPSHPLSDNDGFRTDVLELVRELGVATIRYQGGNFVSGFRWEDAIGPLEDRPTRLDLAWHSTESNEVGSTSSPAGSRHLSRVELELKRAPCSRSTASVARPSHEVGLSVRPYLTCGHGR